MIIVPLLQVQPFEVWEVESKNEVIERRSKEGADISLNLQKKISGAGNAITRPSGAIKSILFSEEKTFSKSNLVTF